MQVKYIKKESTIPNSGIGVFADEFIPKGTLIWKFDPKDFVCFKTLKDLENKLESMPYAEASIYLTFVCFNHGKVYYEFDDAKYINHSSDVKTVTMTSNDQIHYYATKDINKGDELFTNYLINDNELLEKEFEFDRLEKKYNIWVPPKPIENNNNNNNKNEKEKQNEKEKGKGKGMEKEKEIGKENSNNNDIVAEENTPK